MRAFSNGHLNENGDSHKPLLNADSLAAAPVSPSASREYKTPDPKIVNLARSILAGIEANMHLTRRGLLYGKSGKALFLWAGVLAAASAVTNLEFGSDYVEAFKEIDNQCPAVIFGFSSPVVSYGSCISQDFLSWRTNRKVWDKITAIVSCDRKKMVQAACGTKKDACVTGCVVMSTATTMNIACQNPIGCFGDIMNHYIVPPLRACAALGANGAYFSEFMDQQFSSFDIKNPLVRLLMTAKEHIGSLVADENSRLEELTDAKDKKSSESMFIYKIFDVVKSLEMQAAQLTLDDDMDPDERRINAIKNTVRVLLQLTPAVTLDNEQQAMFKGKPAYAVKNPDDSILLDVLSIGLGFSSAAINFAAGSSTLALCGAPIAAPSPIKDVKNTGEGLSLGFSCCLFSMTSGGVNGGLNSAAAKNQLRSPISSCLSYCTCCDDKDSKKQNKEPVTSCCPKDLAACKASVVSYCPEDAVSCGACCFSHTGACAFGMGNAGGTFLYMSALTGSAGLAGGMGLIAHSVFYMLGLDSFKGVVKDIMQSWYREKLTSTLDVSHQKESFAAEYDKASVRGRKYVLSMLSDILVGMCDYLLSVANTLGDRKELVEFFSEELIAKIEKNMPQSGPKPMLKALGKKPLPGTFFKWVGPISSFPAKSNDVLTTAMNGVVVSSKGNVSATITDTPATPDISRVHANGKNHANDTNTSSYTSTRWSCF
ncbi:hypothetical protein AYO45_02270 [Gammaproteobacteria bacterium SCGC AG-212-F23]|nr:hypothetical protein AYO45_02270 [Gammaproteobacteria bacterium SCGC AG-212-F23]